MSETITVPFSHLVLRHREIGIHRGRAWGFRDIFGFPTLRDVPFVTLAIMVKAAYEERIVPAHCGWPAQREALRWLVDKGRDGIYSLDEQGILIMAGRSTAAGIKPPDTQEIRRAGTGPDAVNERGGERFDNSSDLLQARVVESTSSRSDDARDEREITLTISPDHYYIADGNHRALALYVLGEEEVRARFLSEDEVPGRLRR